MKSKFWNLDSFLQHMMEAEFLDWSLFSLEFLIMFLFFLEVIKKIHCALDDPVEAFYQFWGQEEIMEHEIQVK